jgi:hypothetical protein
MASREEEDDKLLQEVKEALKEKEDSKGIEKAGKKIDVKSVQRKNGNRS